jgi:hypothetical protein
VKLFGEIARDMVLLAAVALCLWLFPKTVLAIEGICGLGTMGLFLFERSLR